MYSEPFRLDSERLSKLAYVYAGYAHASREDESQEILINRASTLVIAASLFSLFDVEKARECYWAAFQEYRQLKIPFALTLAVCSTKPEPLDSFPFEQQQDAPYTRATADYYFQKLAHDFWLHGSHADPDVFSKPDRQLVGRLGLPMNLYTRVYRSAFPFSNHDKVLSPIADLLNRVAEVTRVAMQDEFHWQRLYSTILPIEPEILATLLSVVRKQGKETAQSIKESLLGMVDPIGVTYANIAFELLGYGKEPTRSPLTL